MNLYVIRNREGHYFRAKGYGGRGLSWVPELEKAKFYAKFGVAKGRVTYFAGAHPEYGVPEVIAFSFAITDGVSIDMQDYVKESLQRVSARVQAIRRSRLEWERKRIDEQLKDLEKRKATLSN